MTTIILKRDSVCMADDVDAPHECRITLDARSPTCHTLSELVRLVLDHAPYLPSVAGGSTWVARLNGTAVAVVSKAASSDTVQLYPLSAAPKVGSVVPVEIYFEYYLANSPDRLAADLRRGVKPERRYGDRIIE